MAAKKKTAAPVTALTVVQRAVSALGYNDVTQLELSALAKKSEHITAITNDDGYKQVHAARMALKNTRLEIAKRGKAAREDATAFSKAVIAEENRLIALIAPEENRLDLLQTAHDEKIEAEKQAKILAEQQRVERLQYLINRLRGDQSLTHLSGAMAISGEIALVEQIVVDDSYDEFRQQAEDAKVAGLSRLHQLLDAAAAHEQEQQRLREQAAEAEKLRQEVERLRAEAAAREKADREREAEERAAAERAETLRRRQAEAADQAEQQKPVLGGHGHVYPRADGVRARCGGPLVCAQCAQDAARKASEEAPLRKVYDTPPVIAAETVVRELAPAPAVKSEDPPKYARRPTFTEIVDVVAFQFDVEPEVVRTWIAPIAAQEAA